MGRLADFCMLSFGWRRFALLFVAGALCGLTMPPFFSFPLLFVALPVWVWALDGAESGTGVTKIFGAPFSIGFAFGLGYFLVSLHWIGAAFFVDGGWLIWVMPFAVLLVCALLAIYWGLASALAHLFWSHGPGRIAVLALSLTLAEFLRGHLFTGFPFDLIGYSLTANTQMAQLAGVTGVYGLGFLAVLLGASTALIWPQDKRSAGVRLAPFFLAILFIAGQAGWGQYRLSGATANVDEGPLLRLVQPNIDQRTKWQAESRAFVVDQLYTLSGARLGPEDKGIADKAALIWPESATPFYLPEAGDELARISRLLADGQVLITGAPRRDLVEDEAGASYNSVLAIGSDGAVSASYDKTHLVPFGEYLPFRGLFSQLGLTQFVPGSDGWEAGETRRVLALEGLPGFLPLICYEAIFSGDILEGTSPDALLNLTNDGWFDGSIGPAQHFHHARMRTIEEGLAMVRVANSGISGVVDGYGRTTAMLSQGEPGVLDVRVPPKLGATFYSKYRNWPLFWLLVGGFAVLGGLTLRGRRPAGLFGG